MESVFFMLVLVAPPGMFGVQPLPTAFPLIQVNSRGEVAPRAGITENRCRERQFTPNYAAEARIFQSVRWERFPLAIWIDASSVENSEEMSELRAGLSTWSDATGGVLGVTFVEKQDGAQIWVKITSRTVQRDAAHEMGHVLGIAGHTTQPGRIMFRNPMTDAPSLVDVNTIKTKYCELF